MTETHSLIATILKNASYIPAILIGLSLENYMILAVLMIIDTVFGILRVAVVHGGKNIKSYKLISGVLAKITIMSIPLILVWAGRGVGINFHPIASATLGILILAETYSIVGSVYAIHIKKDIPEWDAVSYILTNIQKSIERIIKKAPSNQPTDEDLLDK